MLLQGGRCLQEPGALASAADSLGFKSLLFMGAGTWARSSAPLTSVSSYQLRMVITRALLSFLAKLPRGLPGKELSTAPGTFSIHNSRVYSNAHLLGS